MNTIKVLFSLLTKKGSATFLKLLLTLINKQTQQLIIVLVPQALDIVTELALNNGLTDKQKQKQAFDKISKIAKKEGIEAGNSLINLVIELAVAQTKS